MQISQEILDNSLEQTRELLKPILTSTKGQKENVLRLDGGILIDIIACKILIPIVVSLTSTLLIKKVFPEKTKDKSFEELKKELNNCVDHQIGGLNKKKKKEIIDIVDSQIEKFGGTREQAEKLVESILQVIKKGKKK